MLDVNVAKRLGDFALDVAFSLNNAEITVIFGKSGAGKTTVLNLVAGLARPDSGRICLSDRVFCDVEQRVWVAPERRGLGYVFQQPRLFSHFSVKSNLLFGPRFCKRQASRRQFDRVVELLGIGHLLDRKTNTLSGGESQRVAIGRALLASSSLLLMDEPLSSLDKPRRDELIQHIARIPKTFDIPILYVTHSTHELAALADQVLVMRNGGGNMVRGGKEVPAELLEGDVFELV